MRLSRRSFLRTWLQSLGIGTISLCLGQGQSRGAVQPRAILFLVMDGASWSLVEQTDRLSQLARKRQLNIVGLMQDSRQVRCWIDMQSFDSIVTDSAAASSSWGSGSRVANGWLNRLPDGRALKPLYQLARTVGWRRGLVTTTAITDATPAGFVVSGVRRDEADKIAHQYLEEQVEVLAGGGLTNFAGSSLLDRFREAGYQVITSREGLSKLSTSERWLGLFADRHLPFLIDWRERPDLQQRVPRLPELARMAIISLEKGGKPFILQIEGGRIDHAAHLNDIVTATHELLEFDEVVGLCVQYVKQHEDALLIVTADHGTGGPHLNGIGAEYRDSSRLFARILQGRYSFEAFEKEFSQSGKKASALRGLLQKYRNVSFGDNVWSEFTKYLSGQRKALFSGLDSLSSYLGQLLANSYGVSWTSNSHTSEYVPLVAVGCGAAYFSDCKQNIDIFPVLTRLMGIHYRNPTAINTSSGRKPSGRDARLVHAEAVA